MKEGFLNYKGESADVTGGIMGPSWDGKNFKVINVMYDPNTDTSTLHVREHVVGQ